MDAQGTLAESNGLKVNYRFIPDELKEWNQWVLWKTKTRGGKPVKLPLQSTGKLASTTDPKTWLSFDQARTFCEILPDRSEGIGFVYTSDDPFCGIDLDSCLVPESGFLAQWAKDILAALPGYVEVSPSGCGLKLTTRGRFPVASGDSGKTFLGMPGSTSGKRAEIAVWNERRYFAFTGQVYKDRNTIPEEDQSDKCKQLFDDCTSKWKEEPKQKSKWTSKRPTKSNDRNGAQNVVLNILLRMTTEDGNDGSRRLFTAACRCVEHDLTDDEALATIREYERQKPFPTGWTDAEIIDRIRDAEEKTERGAAVTIANYEKIEVTNEDGSKETIKIPLSMTEIIEEINQHTGDWPRRVDNVLFVDDSYHGLDWFDRRTTAGLFGWLRRRCKIDWTTGGKFVSQAELFAELERTSRKYEAIELLPHEPPVAGVYYRGDVPKPGDGTHLAWLLDRFRPETRIDRDLIQAAFMTVFWGGPVSCRPAFVITSDQGRGAGKTKLAEIIAYLAGGFVDVSAGEDIATLKQRFLSPEGQTKRVAILDNVKSLKLSWAELEALITTPIISGKRMYIGEGQRPNLVTWIVTLNGISLATDMSQRSVILKLVKGENAGGWYEETIQYINEHRKAIIGDIIGALKSERYEPANYTRWATWERDILARLPEPDEAQLVILERQEAANTEADEAEIIEDFFENQLHRLDYLPNKDQVRIPVAIAARWYGWAINEQIKTAAASKRLLQMASERQLRRITADKSRTYGRCFVWTGCDADIISDPILSDLTLRMAVKERENNHDN